jgi:class 3 adenylate cyclase
MVSIRSTDYRFESTASAPVDALVVIFDLGGFSSFFSQPDAHLYVPKFLNRVFDSVTRNFEGGRDYWSEGLDEVARQMEALAKPDYDKFLGDGGLFLWSVGDNATLHPKKIMTLLNRLWNLKLGFARVVDACADVVPVVDLPRTIRFGIARGTAYQLKRRNTGETEYIGYCINLASRLQGYCKQLGFITSARINRTRETLGRHGYLRVVAKNLRGFPKEIVIVDQGEYNALADETRTQLFDALPSAEQPPTADRAAASQ